MTQRKIRTLILVLVGAILAFFWIYALIWGGGIPAQTTANFGGDIRADIQTKIAAADNEISKFVEYAHRTVKVKSLKIVKCEATTTDGGKTVNPDLSNLKEVEVVIHTVWDGWFDKNGESEVHYTLVAENGKLRPTPFRIGETTALLTRAECR